MKSSEVIRSLIARSFLKQKEVAANMGWTQAGFSNRMRRNTISADEFIKIVEMLGYEVRIIESESEDEAFIMRKGVGEHLKMMVGGVTYDTHKADAICHSDETQPVFCELYVDKDGRYFVANYVNSEIGVHSISPIGKDEAFRLESILTAEK